LEYSGLGELVCYGSIVSGVKFARIRACPAIAVGAVEVARVCIVPTHIDRRSR
jgi:hypothetical protein